MASPASILPGIAAMHRCVMAPAARVIKETATVPARPSTAVIATETANTDATIAEHARHPANGGDLRPRRLLARHSQRPDPAASCDLQGRKRYPVRKIRAITSRQIARNTAIMTRLSATLTSALP